MSLRGFIIGILLLAAVFAAGYVPLKLELNRTQEKLQSMELDLKLANLHRELGAASHEAQRNNFAVAADHAAKFFSGCREIEASIPETQPRTKIAISSYAGSRDLIMGDLAMADPATKERLAGLYLAMQGVLERRE